METPKFILDACCGGRMMWFVKNHPNCLYIDRRECPAGHISAKSKHNVTPDLVMDFRNMNLPDKKFKLIVWDPPHRTDFTKTSIMAKQYGILDKENWAEDLRRGFDECWRVLDNYGVLIFKWNEKQIKLKKVLELFPVSPLFGNIRSGAGYRSTYWMCFMKIPKEVGGKWQERL